MATISFADISNYNWQPTTVYQAIQTLIQEEVNQGLWTNEAHIDSWCFVLVSSPWGVNNSWVTYTYQLSTDTTQRKTVNWPCGWPAPSENINGDLPHHFFSGIANAPTSGLSPAVIGGAPHASSASPSGQPAYRIAGDCV